MPAISTLTYSLLLYVQQTANYISTLPPPTKVLRLVVPLARLKKKKKKKKKNNNNKKSHEYYYIQNVNPLPSNHHTQTK